MQRSRHLERPPAAMRRLRALRLARARAAALAGAVAPMAAALAGALAGVLAGALAAPAVAQSLPPVVVEGLRASGESAEQRKRQAEGIVDSVVSSELNRLPDLSVGDALQRVPGVQITRDRGEASSFAVRGLTQVDTLLNGREVFTASGARTLDLADLPTELLSGIDVYKTAAADRSEGGIGGTVDLRTRRPLELPQGATRFALRRVEGDLVGRAAWQGSLLASRRLPLEGGELGLLANLVYQDRAWREDQKSLGVPQLRSDLVPGSTLVAPGGSSETVSLGLRRRQAASLIAQWRAHAGLEWTLEAHQAELLTRQDSHQINLSPGGVAPGSVSLFDGRDAVERIAWTDAPVSLLGFARDTLDRTRQLASHGRIELGGPWALDLDAAHTRSTSRLFFSGPVLASTAARFEQDVGRDPAATRVPGGELEDAANWRYTGVAYRVRPFAGQLDELRADLHWQLDAPVVERVAFGWRSARRQADNEPGLVFGDAPAATPLAGTAGGLRRSPFGDFLGGTPSVTNHLIADLRDARDPQALRDRLGVVAPLPGEGNPLGVWEVSERSDAAYLRADLRDPARALEGMLGLRVVRTAERLDGTRSLPSEASSAPLRVRESYVDLLPSASARWVSDAGPAWRAAVSRTLTRPGFDQLSPSLVLLQNSVDPSLNVGSAGNPRLRPIRSTNVDLALESAPDDRLAWSVTAFWKRVEGFVVSASRPETWDGVVYQVTRPYNADTARIVGVELAGRYELQSWPGFGLQGNYTWTDSRTPDRRLGTEVPLQNLSRHSANLMAYYERGPAALRLAWNGRSEFLSGVNQIVGLGAQPVYTRGYGWLDASFGWQLNRELRVSLDVGNLLRTRRSAYVGTPDQPQTYWLNDRQWVAALSLAL